MAKAYDSGVASIETTTSPFEVRRSSLYHCIPAGHHKVPPKNPATETRVDWIAQPDKAGATTCRDSGDIRIFGTQYV